VERVAHGRAGEYVSYEPRGAPKEAGQFSCLATDIHTQLNGVGANLGSMAGTRLRTYRLALAATAEYTQTYGGGTISGALATMTTLINAIDAIYERDLSIRLKLIDNETSIIFTNSATDGYTSDSANSLLTQNQTILDQRIGAANYDIGFVLDGHVYAFQPGFFLFQGVGQFQSVCANGQKGKGVTILRSIDPSSTSAIWDVAHEMGHQFGALHTFNGTTEDCGPSRFAQVAYEPGSGSTIMGYRGGVAPNGTYLPLCTFEDLHSVDTYFHIATIEQILNFTTFGGGSTCGVLTDTGNSVPLVSAGPDYTIPANTPFTLTATASDADGDALTYCWEEYDLGAAGPPHTDNGNRPIFRSFAPVPSPARTFPQLLDILSGSQTFGESLPVTTRTMNFRVTVRDNHVGGGGVSSGSMHVNVCADSGPFAVTQPVSATTWAAGSNQTVTWDVANTSSAPVSCTNVRVLLSIDGGNSFPFVLLPSTPNTGTATVMVPNMPGTTARVKVEAIDNVFFNVSHVFSITANSTGPPVLLTEANSNRAIALDSVTFMALPFPITAINNFSLDQRTRVALFAVGLELIPGEDTSVVSAQAKDANDKIYPLPVEFVGKVPGFPWLTQLVVKLPGEFFGVGDLLISLQVHGTTSNTVLIGIR
jgi:reprolysin-like metallo-peptidase family M12B